MASLRLCGVSVFWSAAWEANSALSWPPSSRRSRGSAHWSASMSTHRVVGCARPSSTCCNHPSASASSRSSPSSTLTWSSTSACGSPTRAPGWRMHGSSPPTPPLPSSAPPPSALRWKAWWCAAASRSTAVSATHPLGPSSPRPCTPPASTATCWPTSSVRRARWAGVSASRSASCGWRRCSASTCPARWAACCASRWCPSACSPTHRSLLSKMATRRVHSLPLPHAGSTNRSTSLPRVPSPRCRPSCAASASRCR